MNSWARTIFAMPRGSDECRCMCGTTGRNYGQNCEWERGMVLYWVDACQTMDRTVHERVEWYCIEWMHVKLWTELWMREWNGIVLSGCMSDYGQNCEWESGMVLYWVDACQTMARTVNERGEWYCIEWMHVKLWTELWMREGNGIVLSGCMSLNKFPTRMCLAKQQQ